MIVSTFVHLEGLFLCIFVSIFSLFLLLFSLRCFEINRLKYPFVFRHRSMSFLSSSFASTGLEPLQNKTSMFVQTISFALHSALRAKEFLCLLQITRACVFWLVSCLSQTVLFEILR